ncbi:hypothetical protein PCL1606_34750 [Pseudomonas chlororaphis]|uniref:Uncharacterized protein n=1 Tax=Pseudomonas chlororaphis TaxID=587753 RepID=A0A0D5Y0U1_9PSED|nr:hypothetical protein PCL1606_34750 [Pseudomonas chlororaphis]
MTECRQSPDGQRAIGRGRFRRSAGPRVPVGAQAIVAGSRIDGRQHAPDRYQGTVVGGTAETGPGRVRVGVGLAGHLQRGGAALRIRQAAAVGPGDPSPQELPGHARGRIARWSGYRQRGPVAEHIRTTGQDASGRRVDSEVTRGRSIP